MRRPLPLVLALALAGCPAGKPPAPPTAPTPRPAATRPADGGSALAAATRVVANNGAALVLRGEARLLSERGTGVVSNHGAAIVGKIRAEGAGIVGKIRGEGGGLVANNGAGVVANNGAGVVSDHAGGIVGKLRYGLAQAAPAAAEASLADAVIEIYDAQGRQLVDAAGKPVTATTDAKGAYRLEARLPAEPLVLVIRLADDVAGGAGGELAALAVPAPTGELVVRLDTASTLGAAFVAARLVAGRPGALAKLPAAEAQALARDAEAARAFLPAGRLGYGTDEMAAAAEGLRAKAPAFDATIKRIAAILLAGQANLGEGLAATAVALTTPTGVVGDGQGALWIAEQETGRLRRGSATDPTTPLALVVDGDAPIGTIDGLARTPDGTLWIADRRMRRVWRVGPDGRPEAVAGADAATKLGDVAAINVGRDGTLLVCESPSQVATRGRILRLTAGGALTEVAYPEAPAGAGQPSWNGAVDLPDGAIVAFSRRTKRLEIQRPGRAWEPLVLDVEASEAGRLTLGPDGQMYVSDPLGDRIWRIAPDGTKALVAGSLGGEQAHTPDGALAAGAPIGSPAGLWVDADGTVVFCETGDGLIRAITPDGRLRTLAGARASTSGGLAAGLAINGPGPIAYDGAGRLLIGEGLSGTVKRLEGDRLTTVAGTTLGKEGDGGPATAASFQSVFGLAVAREADGEALYIADQLDHRIRRVGPDGIVDTVVDDGPKLPDGRRTYPARASAVATPTAIVQGPDGRMYFLDSRHHQLLRLSADRREVEVVAGSLMGEAGVEGDDGPAAQARLTFPFALALDAAGHLYIADAGAFTVRMIDLNDPAMPITTIAGLGAVATLARDMAGQGPVRHDGVPARQASLVAPISLAVDAAGDLYVGEGGKERMTDILGIPAETFASSASVPSTVWKIAMREPGRPMRRVAGPGSRVLHGEGGEEALGVPTGLAADPAGGLVISDGVRNQVKRVPPEALGP